MTEKRNAPVQVRAEAVRKPPDGDRAADIPLENFLTYRLLILTNRLNRQAVRILDDTAGLRLPEWRCLAFIASQRRMSLNEIAERTAMDRGLISRSVQGLVEKGHILVERDAVDRRLVFAIVTRGGEKLYRTVLPIMQRRQARLLGSLSDTERRSLYRSIDKLNRCLDDWPGFNSADRGPQP